MLTPKAKKNKDKPRGIAMVSFLPVHGGLHKFEIHSTNIGERPRSFTAVNEAALVSKNHDSNEHRYLSI